MKINRNNYEIYFLDYLEGNLVPEKEAELLAFLEEHPHLKEVFENFEQIHLAPLEVLFKKKEELKKPVPSLDIIDESNCEHYFVAYLEGDLPGDKKQEVQDFLKAHPKYLSSFELQQRTKLVADNSIFYSGKNRLRKSIFERPVAKPFYFYASAAATVFIIFFVYFYNNSGQSTDKKIIAEKEIPKPSVKQQEKKPERDKARTGIEVVVTEEKQQNKKSYAAQTTSGNKLAIKKNAGNRGGILTPEILANPSANPVADNINRESIKEGQLQKDSLVFIEMPLAENNNQEQKISKASSPNPENDFLSIKELMVVKFKKAVNSKEGTDPENEKNRKLSFWNLTDMIAGGISKLTGKTWKVNKKYNETGNVTAFAVVSDKFEFSRTITRE